MPVDIYKRNKDVLRALKVLRKSSSFPRYTNDNSYKLGRALIGILPEDFGRLGSGCNAVAFRVGSVAAKRAGALDFTYYYLLFCQRRLRECGSIHSPLMSGLPEVLAIERCGSGYIAVMPVYTTWWDNDEDTSAYEFGEYHKNFQDVCQTLKDFALYGDPGNDTHSGNVMLCAERMEYVIVDPGLSHQDAPLPRDPALKKARQAAWKAQEARFRS